jgi:hypothetical protein
LGNHSHVHNYGKYIRSGATLYALLLKSWWKTFHVLTTRSSLFSEVLHRHHTLGWESYEAHDGNRQWKDHTHENQLEIFAS